MDDEGKVFESIRVLLQSVRQLSDRFLEADASLNSRYEQLASDLSSFAVRLERLEKTLLNNSSLSVVSDDLRDSSPQSDHDSLIQISYPINLPLTKILDTYSSSPVLLEPFSHPCGVNARTLNGETESVELETYSQGLFWAISTLDHGWILVPRPGSLQRKIQIQSLERLFEIDGLSRLPALLHLVQPSEAEPIVHGRRWQLKQKGILSIHPDPLRYSMADQLSQLEVRLRTLESLTKE